MKLPIQYIHAECLNFVKCALMYGKTVIFDRIACADCGGGERNAGLDTWRSMRALMERPASDLSLLQITDITPSIYDVDNIKSFIRSK